MRRHTIYVHVLLWGSFWSCLRVLVVDIVANVDAMLGFFFGCLDLLADEVAKFVVQVVIHGCCGVRRCVVGRQTLGFKTIPSRRVSVM